MTKEDWQEIIKIITPILKAGGFGVFPTDTLYGVVGVALNAKTVEEIYQVRKRQLDKPFIILISSLNDLKKFGVRINTEQKKTLHAVWPGKVSVVFECKNKKMEHLHRGKKTLAFRLPEDLNLCALLKKTGPLVAPSANLSGKEAATTYAEAKKYFSKKVDFYVDGGKLKSKSSTLVSIDVKGNLTVLRQGAVKIAKKLILA